MNVDFSHIAYHRAFLDKKNKKIAFTITCDDLSVNVVNTVETKSMLAYLLHIISPIHTFVNIPALLLKNTLRFLITAGILTKV